ncbi:MAG: class I tRNA ligase family protein [Patescibacteria group bacterium]
MAEENKSKIAEREEEILKFWQENKIFEKSLEKEAPNGNFVFFDGPPFATGLPHYGHILPGTIKDVIPRYQTMKGKRVVRKWGWDCHGLPIENLVEKELGLSSKKDIETFGVGRFNMAARRAVMRYANEWKKIIPRSGRWIDMEDDYKTMDTSYTESVWWAFKNLYDKGLVYKSFKSMHICPHCETTLSNFEINQGYKDITDISVYIKFPVVGEKDTYFLAWTTTPWTLPGNVALAINKNTIYVKAEKEKQIYILAKDLIEKVIKENYKIIEEFSGDKLLGKSYTPLFSYYDNDKLENRQNGFKVYHGDFVTTTDGTGIVHIAPAFGEDDMNLGKSENLPFVQHVNIDGTFKKEVINFAPQKVKPKDDHQKADVEVIKFLAKAGTLFEKEKIIHSYPHCWRCETPLLNYATTSWFVKVSEIKDKMVEINKNIAWNPKEIGEGRFGKWLEGARDWAISRSRYWGAPLPVWENDKKELFVLGSIDELKKHIKKSGNKYFIMRHGEADSNVNKILSSKAEHPHHLTEKGISNTKKIAEGFKKEKIDVIISSPFIRTRETAEIVAEVVGLDKKEIQYDKRIGEHNYGDLDLGLIANYHNYYSSLEEAFVKPLPNGENYNNTRARAGEFIYGLEKKFSNKNILIITHESPAWLMFSVAEGLDVEGCVKLSGMSESFLENSEFKKLDFVPLPHNENYELDLHQPFIDEVELVDENNSLLKRVPEVFDCWFESGSMSFAQHHYPFENKEEFEKKNSLLFPADFIAEGLDQTRGWFYTLLVLGTGLFEKSPYNSVIVNGMILAEDGRKMSKSLNNYPDPMYIIDKYGADSLRYYLMSSSAVKAEDLNFSEKGVDEVSKKVILKLENVLSFYEMYRPATEVANFKSSHILDRWILLRLAELNKDITLSLDSYKIDSATRPILDFIDDLSTWYIRRSRDRFKSEDTEDRNNALATTRYVLVELAKHMAPFMPFFAEHLYLKLKAENDSESVHLCDWPVLSEVEGSDVDKINEEILNNMEGVRIIVSLALEKRMTANIKVRQPLQKLTIFNFQFSKKEGYVDLIKDEINVKEVIFSENKKYENKVELDTEITDELQKEGNVRGLIRAIQELRKQKNLTPSDAIELLVETNDAGKEFINSFAEEIKKPTNVSKINFAENEGEEIEIDKVKYKIKII